MKNERAKNILQALVNGIDPETHEDLPPGTVLNRPDVMRAIIAAVTALSNVVARDYRRASLPKNIGKTWSEVEKSKLVEEFRSGTPIADIANAHGRTVRAIESRLEAMALITVEQRTTKDRDAYDKP